MNRLTVFALVLSLQTGCATLGDRPAIAKPEPAAPSEIPQRIGTAVKCAVTLPVGGAAGGLLVGAYAPPAVLLTVPIGVVVGAVAGVNGALRALFEGDKSCGGWLRQARR